MGILNKFLNLTPFYKSYKKLRTDRAVMSHQKMEAKLLPLRTAFYKQFINPTDLVFDVGANEGNRVHPFLACYARVIAVEPQPSCIDILHKKFGDKIIIENVGLSDEPGELEMSIASDSTISSFSKDFIKKTEKRFEFSKWEKTIQVPVTTLDHMIEKYGVPNFCKIDVEGFELQVLKGLHSQIPLLSFEYCIPEMQDLLLSCLQYANTLTPEAKYNYSVGETMSMALVEWKSYADFIKMVNKAPFAKSLFGDIYIRSR